LSLILRHLRENGARRVVSVGVMLFSVAELIAANGLKTHVLDQAAMADPGYWHTFDLGRWDVVYVNTPHNPSGTCLSPSALGALAARRSKARAAVVFDLVYDSYIHSGKSRRSPLSHFDGLQGIYAINSFSKNYGAPGLRVGWITADPQAVESLVARMEHERIAIGVTAQRRAAQLCANGNAALRERVRVGLETVRAWLAARALDMALPEGGTQFWFDFGSHDAETFADLLMARKRLVVATSANYRPCVLSGLRVPLGQAPYVIEAALDDIWTLRLSGEEQVRYEA
jgi:beta-methylarginine biosynthesis bifunctional aminotransferase